MKQPELGIKICSIRNQQGLTQKELSESCNIDIRTLQRIESGNVTPRISTLKLLAEALSCDIDTFLDEKDNLPEPLSHAFLASIFKIGIVYFLTWLLFSFFQVSIPINLQGAYVSSLGFLIAVIYAITGVFFYYGFYRLGKHSENVFLWISSLVVMICIPLFLLTALMTIEYSFAKHLNTVVLGAMNINSIFLGIGLLMTKSPLKNWYTVAGILQLLAAPFFLFGTPVTQLIGFWFSIPFLLLLLTLVYKELKHSTPSKSPCPRITTLP